MKKIFFLALTVVAFILKGSELRFPKQALPRSNEIVIGDTHISVSRETTVPSGWAINAYNGNETRKLPLVLDGVNRIFFPGVILEMRNWGVSKNESWNMLAETIGNFEVRELTPAEVIKNEKSQIRTEKRRPGETLMLSNGKVYLEVLPASNGIVPCIRSEISGNNIANVGNLNRDMSLKDFTGVGFIELFNSYGNTPMASMNWKFENGVLELHGKSDTGRDLSLHREMTLLDNAFAFRIASSVVGTGKLPQMKHRPEIRLPGQFGVNALAMFLPDKGRLYPKNVQGGSYELDGISYALGDKETGLMLGVYYQNAAETYIYVAEKYMTLEATGLPSQGKPVAPLTVTYFFVHGLSRADFIGNGVLLAVPEKNQVGMTGRNLQIAFTLGNAIPLNSTAVQLEIADEKGLVLASQEQKLPALQPGFASRFDMEANTKELHGGRYVAHVMILDAGNCCLNGSFPIQMLSQDDLQKARDFLTVLDQRIEAIRKENVAPDGRRALMKRFREALLRRKEYTEALDAGNMDRIIELQRITY